MWLMVPHFSVSQFLIKIIMVKVTYINFKTGQIVTAQEFPHLQNRAVIRKGPGEEIVMKNIREAKKALQLSGFVRSFLPF